MAAARDCQHLDRQGDFFICAWTGFDQGWVAAGCAENPWFLMIFNGAGADEIINYFTLRENSI
jgi:hypothetical protein